MNDQLVIKVLSILLQSIKPKKSISVEMRDQFLSVFCIVLINAQDKSKFCDLVETLVSDGRLILDDMNTSELSGLEIELFDSLSSLFKENVGKKVLSAFKNIYALTANVVLTKLECILIYEGVLQRLQESRGKNVLATDFTCFYINEALLDVIEPFIPTHPGVEIYDPFCQRAEMLSYASSVANKVVTTSEALKQSKLYIKHKLALANANESHHFQRSSLSAETTINEGMFDFAITAYVASASVAETPNLNSHDLKGHIDPRRINIDVLDKVKPESKSKSKPKSKFKEHALMQQMLWSLKKSGTALIIAGKGPLQREQEIKARSELVLGNKVHCVIRLHDKVLGGRATAIYALSFQKSGSNTQTIQFIDARSLFSLDNAHVRIREKNNYLNIIKKRQNIEGLSRLVSFVEVERNSFNLCPEAYVSASSDEIEVNTDEIRSQLRQQIKITDKLFAELFRSGN
jgi:type I restriction-modification system DNA methylase subunit